MFDTLTGMRAMHSGLFVMSMDVSMVGCCWLRLSVWGLVGLVRCSCCCCCWLAGSNPLHNRIYLSMRCVHTDERASAEFRKLPSILFLEKRRKTHKNARFILQPGVRPYIYDTTTCCARVPYRLFFFLLSLRWCESNIKQFVRERFAFSGFNYQ